MKYSEWTTLEAAKLVVALFTPITVAALGVYINRVTKKFEHLQWRSQKLVEKRLALYDEIAPAMNDLLCYFTYVGCWKDLSPPEVIRMKRAIDKTIYLAAPLFSPNFLTACLEFQDICFQTNTGYGKDAKLRTNGKDRREFYLGKEKWNHEWDSCFSAEQADREAVRNAYRKVMEAFAVDIGIHPLRRQAC